MSKMQKAVATLKATIAIAAILGAAGGGFKAGGYWEASKAEKSAIAFSCGEIDRETRRFSYVVPYCIAAAEEMARKATQEQQTQKGRTAPPSAVIFLGGAK